MKSNNTVDGIGRRRGQSSTTKNVGTSILVAVGAFVLVSTLLFLLSMNFSSVKEFDVTTYEKDAPPASKGSIRNSQNKLLHDGSSDFDEFGEIMRGELHLVEINTSGIRTTKDGYKGGKAIFCKLNWSAYKKDPPSLPMFRFLVTHSGCDGRKNQVVVDLAMIAEKTKAYDESQKLNNRSDVRSMHPTGFVFHESRVGSTLVANSLTAMTTANRVYSESNPINTALKADNPQLFRDVVYLMGRTNRAEEHNLFFKVSSIGSKRISVMREAFPDTPWIFVYREPVQTMMSHLDPAKVGATKKGIMAVCTRARHNPPQDLYYLVEQHGKKIDKLSDQEFCAAHLASLCESALHELKKLDHHGRAVEYDGLIDKLLDDVIPNHFGVAVDNKARQRVMEVSKTYSKAKTLKSRDADWVEDSEKKEVNSTPEIRSASELFLSKSYADLKKYSV